VDRLDTLDRANRDGHFSRPDLRGDLGVPGRRSCWPGPSLSGAIIFAFAGFPFNVFGLFFYGLPFDVVGFVF
jgi:hypothetical protein